MRERMFKKVGRMAVLLIGSAVLGTLLLTLVFCLPVSSMRQHVTASVEAMIPNEDALEKQENSFLRYLLSERETYTDVIMVQNAIERVEGRNAYEHAMWAYHYDLEEDVWTPENSLKAIFEGKSTDDMFLHMYARYWHGYLVYLKPLLMVFDWSQIVVLGVVLQLCLMAVLIICSVRRGQAGVGIATVAGFLFMKPTLVLISLDMSVCWIITLGALLTMVLKHEKLERGETYPELFLMIGILVAYFDFLTYPVVTLGFPLCIYFMMQKSDTLKRKLQKLVGYSICWGGGYAGMWGMKWLIADLTLHTGTIRDAAWSIIGRTEAIGGRSRMNGGWYVISLNFQEYRWELYTVMAVVVALFVAITLLVALGKGVDWRKALGELLVYALVFCIPFMWIIVVQHHSALHARFTFRIISVAALAMISFGISLIQTIFSEKCKKS